MMSNVGTGKPHNAAVLCSANAKQIVRSVFLPPLPAGMKRAEFMAEVKARLEGASARLVADNAR